MRTGEYLDFSSSPVLTHTATHVKRLSDYFEQTCDWRPDGIAVVCGSSRLTYLELDRRANRLAHLLLERGVEEGTPVGILLERSLDMYVALLGVLKAGAAYVPLDPSFPADLVAFIAQDAGLRDLVTTSALREQTQGLACPVLELDEAVAQLAVQSASRPQISIDPSSLCYIIYTSGSTGQPKGVAVSHASIVNFLRVATPIYNVTSEDRVYQGMTITFDFTFEEIWPAWIAGATLVAGPTDSRRLGQGLTDFLIEHEVTVLCCVPTLLTTLEDEVPSLRCLLVGGEACPADLVRRWSRPGRRMLNTYGPTETTVTATCCELLPDRPVTLGTPLPTYRVYILDEQLRPVEEGGSGEICIGGPGVAIGYHNRPDLTAERFVPNPHSHERAEVPRLYRTGDLGRFTSSEEIEYLGRIDTQVKIRGYRIELGEIEEVLRQDRAVKNAIVTPLEVEGVVQDLVGYVTLHDYEAQATDADLRQRLHACLRRRLPPYMVPSFIEVLDAFPLLAADKVDRATLPPPASPPLGLQSGPHVPAETPLEGQLAAVWGQVLGREDVSVEDDFFCDLGGHSLAAARLISRLRRQPELQGLSIGDLYAHPTIRSLAQFIEADLAAPTDEQPVASVRSVDARDVEDLPGPASGRCSSTDQVLVCAGYEHAVRWREGERLEHLFEDQCDWMRENGRGDHLAVDAGDVVLTYDQLDARANQLARHLLTRGARPGDRIGLVFDQAVPSYVGMLAVLKINAAYVPLDVSFPPGRLSYIVHDAGVRIVLSLSHLRDRLQRVAATLLCVDEVEALVAAEDDHRLTDAEKGDPVDELCYIIYTSGSTGRPKGVAIQHASICNFVRVAVEVYGMESRDRVYQGMTIAFDFSVEEIWVPLLAGATLVPKPGGSSLLGHELREFLQAKGITALCCVPTLLATLDEDLPGLRFLLVSGEACPQDLIARWHKSGRRFLNVYGPTEATVTATWTPVHPDRPVTLGVPLPTYSVVILDPVEQKALPPGEMGEIGIAGIGLASGYVNRDDLTDRAFIRDFLGTENNPSGRIYRTGDLGRVNDDGEIEYHGRIDAQVKIRGYRVELTEIESVLLQVPGIAQAVVNTYEPEPGVVELVAYYSLRKDTASVNQEHVYEQLRGRLPGYMIPAYLEELAVIPMLPSGKADRKNLPAPKGPRSLATQHSYAGPTTGTERILADVLTHVLRLERVSVDSHFFDDLGANSLLMARFCARVRERGDLPCVSMKDVYLHPTIRSLATALEEAAPAPAESRVPASREAVASASTSQYVLCAILQFLLFLGYSYLIVLVLVRGYEWISAGTGLIDIYVRSLIFSGVSFLGLCTAPILAKWMLVGRWKPQEIPVWSLAYVRFWTVKTLVRSNPLVLFVGSPLYVLYLRALGARVGRGVAIFSRNVPVCTDLLTIGDGTVIRKDSFFPCYRAYAGRIQTGAVTLGKDVFVGEATVIDIETSLGDGAQLGHCSSLHASQAVPDGQRWHGSPAQRTDVDYRAVDPIDCGTLRKVSYNALQLLNVLVLGSLGITVAVMLLTEVGLLVELTGSGPLALTRWTFYGDGLAISFVLFFGAVLAGLAFVVTVPRVLNLALRPDRVYPLYGFHYWVQQTIARMTNIKFFTFLFGDSSYIVHYLRSLGYDLSRVEQTGSNFGMAVKHETPYLSFVGSGTMVSDGLSIINADFSSTSFRVSRASIGPRSFLGNNIAYPSQGKTGDNCLLATKVMVPIDGDVREGVGLLGSPCFEIPRSVQRDSSFDHLKSGDELRRRLAAKNKHNAVTIAAYLLVRWIYFFGVTLLGLVTVDLNNRFGASMIAVGIVLTLVFTVSYFVLVDRAVTGFRALSPQFCSIYEPYFWRHERFWKVPAMMYVQVFNGTPFKSAIWRLLGVRLGSRVFDDGGWMTERTLVTIGNDCTLNAGSTIQSHSLEDGTFKSDHITIGAGCTLGTNAFVHYGVTMGDGAVLDADSFLMKGEEIAPHARWRGNPAREIRDVSPVGPAAVALPVTAAPTTTGATSVSVLV